MRLRFALLLVSLLLLGPGASRAQQPIALTADETRALEAAESRRFIEARELANTIIRANADSFVGHFVLALVEHEGEANFPVAYREQRRALELYASVYGDPPRPDAPFRFHAQMLLSLAEIEGDFERHAERLATIGRYNALYSPKLIAERAWSLMKLRRFDEARLAAREAIGSDMPWQVEMGLNALCAVEFEAGEYGKSYEACLAALEFGRASPDGPAVVDLTNFAEAARTDLKLSESEAALVEATTIDDGGYGNPWLELGELYVREGRLDEALRALREVPGVRMRRVPSMRDSDRAESRRALATFYLAMGRAEDARRIADDARRAPDRRGHNSRDPEQDRAVVALIDRHAKRFVASTALEVGRGGGLRESVSAWLRAARLRYEAWESGRMLVQYLEDETKLVGLLRLGLSTSGITPSWLVSDLIDIVGAGVFVGMVREAREGDRRPLAPGYYDAMEAEGRLALGQSARALALARSAISRLPAEENLLEARVRTVEARALDDLGRKAEALTAYAQALELDATVLRRLGLALPARVAARGGGDAEAVAERLESSCRFDDTSGAAEVRLETTASGIGACVVFPGRSPRCTQVAKRSGESREAFARRATAETYGGLFAPPVPLSATDVSALEGPTRRSSRSLDVLP